MGVGKLRPVGWIRPSSSHCGAGSGACPAPAGAQGQELHNPVPRRRAMLLCSSKQQMGSILTSQVEEKQREREEEEKKREHEDRERERQHKERMHQRELEDKAKEREARRQMQEREYEEQEKKRKHKEIIMQLQNRNLELRILRLTGLSSSKNSPQYSLLQDALSAIICPTMPDAVENGDDSSDVNDDVDDMGSLY
ncbi:zinc finger CCCH domain-containing protein 13-like isoform X3 [Gopherus flavomarginatus]|uniref:zinc finger CCCH domain-containing protein 13-like isoform X3 n=1 Tax=Gopherus flavomarginatus TaxID=286002 RepID=UPI0021CC2296|nr:zinc finger CCCH domain-containing protein 13-like isoform X3 [Gopherus flavomarginatus]